MTSAGNDKKKGQPTERHNETDSEAKPEPKNRSVNDFDTADGLRSALKSTEIKEAFCEVGRDFPRALVGSSFGVPRDDDSMSECSIPFEPEQADLDWVLTNYNAEMSRAQSLDEELKRLQVLRSYLILDSEREANFERLTALASRMFHVPIALVSLVDLGRQWFMSNRGLGDVRETPRKHAFCAHAVISKKDMLIVPDATLDHRFCENPLVTGPPHIRFYGGAPLTCPEGFRLGTLCLIDSKPRPQGLSLEEKQNLRELADLVVDAMVERRREKLQVLQDKSQIIATTAHDLLTPLSGVQLSLALLLEDDELRSRMNQSQVELIETANSCGEMMSRICHQSIETFRGDLRKAFSSFQTVGDQDRITAPGTVVIADMVKKLNMVMEPYPKKVPLFISVDHLVPSEVVTDDLKIFRSAINFLTNACKKCENGSVHLKLYVAGKKKNPKLVFECEDTGPGVPHENYPYLFRPFRENDAPEQCLKVGPDGAVNATNSCHMTMANSGLGLYSVANQISSIGGEYGFRPRNAESKDDHPGAIFWFCVPLVVPRRKEIKERHPPATITTYARGPETSNKREPSKKEADVSVGQRTGETMISNQPKERGSVTNASAAPGVTVTKRPEENGKRVRRALVVDDSVVIRKSISRALEKLGFDVTPVTNGLEGLKELQHHLFDLVLCDFLMPVMDGLDCVQQYRDWEELHRPWFRQYIVGISAHASPLDVDKGQQAGMNDFKAKPVTIKQLKSLSESDELTEVSKKLDKLLCVAKDGGKPVEIRAGDAPTEPLEPPAQEPSETSVEEPETSHPQSKVLAGCVRPGDSSRPIALIAEQRSGASSRAMIEISRERGWQTVVVTDGEDCLRLLKMRNWDAVFLDHELPRLTGFGCVARFREWEKENRVAKQSNVFLLSPSVVPDPDRNTVSAAYPAGFDGAIGKPIFWRDLTKLLEQAESKRMADFAASSDIMSR